MASFTPARRPIHQEHTLGSTPSPPRARASSPTPPPNLGASVPTPARPAAAATRPASTCVSLSPVECGDVQDELVSTLRRELSPQRRTSAGMALSPGERPGVWRGYEVGPASANHQAGVYVRPESIIRNSKWP
jgi:hypothetical protein